MLPFIPSMGRPYVSLCQKLPLTSAVLKSVNGNTSEVITDP